MQTQTRKSWHDKLETDYQPHIEKTLRSFAGIRAGQMILVPSPKVVDAYIRQIPKGHQVDMSTLRKNLAAEFHAEACCPLTTGIFVRIAAEAAWEEYQAGEPLENITPFWRVITEHSPTAKKLSFGTDFLHKMRKKEHLN